MHEEAVSVSDLFLSLVNAYSTLRGLIQPQHKRVLEEVGVWSICKALEGDNETAQMGNHIDVITKFSEALGRLMVNRQFSTNPTKDNLEQSFSLVHFGFYSGCCLVLHPEIGIDSTEERAFTTVVLQRLIPACVKFYSHTMASERTLVGQYFKPHSSGDWLANSWGIICYFLLSANSTPKRPCGRYIEPALALLARLLRIYLPWLDADRPDSSAFEFNGFDIRKHVMFVSLLQAGLLHSDNATRKQSLYVLKQTVKFSTFYLMSPSPAGGKEASNHWSVRDCTDTFQWWPSERDRQSQIWQQFFLLYESVHETQVHIVEPLLPMLKSMITSDGEGQSLGRAWWQIILERAIAADSGNVRRRVLQSVLEINCREMQKGDVSEGEDFFFGKTLEALDYSALYQTGADDGASIVSPFGVAVAKFYARYLAMKMESSTSSPEKALIDFFEGLMARVHSATPTLFLLQSLLQLDPIPVATKASLRYFNAFARNAILFHNLKARRLARWQLLYAFMKLADTQSLSFTDVADALHSFFLEHTGLTTECKEYVDVARWHHERFPLDYIDRNLELAIQQYFQAFATEPYAAYGTVALMDWQAGLERAEELSTMLTFTLDREEGGFAQCVRPLYQQLALMVQLEEAAPNPMVVTAAIALFVKLNESVASVSAGKVDLLSSMDVSPRLYEWLAVVESVLLGDSLQDLGLAPISTLLEGMRLFMGKAVEKPDALVTYVNMLLYKLVELVKDFAKQYASQEAEGYLMQLQKLVVFSLMASSLKTLEHIKVYHLGFTDAGTLKHFFDCELEKPPRLTDAQADDWDSLIISFSVNKWSLISTISRFSSNAPELHGVFPVTEVFERCILALESAKYKSVLAILECMRVLTEILPTDQVSLRLIEESIAVTRSIIDETTNTPIWYYLYAEGFIDYLFQPALLSRSEVAGDVDSPIGCVLDYLIHGAGARRKNIVARLARNLQLFWSTPDGHASRMCLLPYFTELLQFGPCREESEDRVAQSLTLSNHEADSEEQRREVLESLGTGADYLVRTQLNSVLLHLEPEEGRDRDFAMAVFDALLDTVAHVKA